MRREGDDGDGKTVEKQEDYNKKEEEERVEADEGEEA